MKRKKVVVFLFLAIALGSFVLFREVSDFQKSIQPASKEPFSLVAETVSQGGNITLSIPKSFVTDDMTTRISFRPKIAGKWLPTKKEGALVFQPEQELETETYIDVTLKTPDGDITEDFRVVAPPKIVNVFPQNGSETNEYSDITVVFNRPMVSLTALGEWDQKEIPITLTPETAGRWKWLGTRTLQFQPKTHLQRSANYTITIRNDFVSVDGVSVSGTKSAFFTRPLRVEYMTSGQISFSRPLVLAFNQPVDLEKTIAQLSIEGRDRGEKEKANRNISESWSAIPFFAEYEQRGENIDESRLLLWPKKDVYGREKVWDFEHEYRFTLKKAFPKKGDIFIESPQNGSFSVDTIIKKKFASSERSPYANFLFFDPEGKAGFEFYEEVDLEKTIFESDVFLKKEYGKKCIEENAYTGAECKKEDDKKVILLSFPGAKIIPNQKWTVALTAVVNADGFSLNTIPFDFSFRAPPPLKVFSLHPKKAKRIDVCTNTPLLRPDKDRPVTEFLTTTPDSFFRSWSRSRRIENTKNEDCAVGEFSTTIFSAIASETDYLFRFSLEDVFGQRTKKEYSFHSGKKTDIAFYSYQDDYVVTTPEATKLTFGVENMKFVDVQICELSARDMLLTLQKRPSYNAPEIGKPCVWKTNTRLSLPDIFWKKSIFQMQLADYLPKKTGHFVLRFSHPDYRDYSNKIVYERSYVSLSNIGILAKELRLDDYGGEEKNDLRAGQKEKLNNLFWITNIATTKGIDGAEVEIFSHHYKTDRLSSVGTFVTNAAGIVRPPVVTNFAGAIVRVNEESAILSEAWSANSNLNYASSARNRDRIFVFPDRPIYRPGDRVFLKGFVRTEYDGKYEFTPREKSVVAVRDPRGAEIFSKEVTLNDFGTFTTEFFIDEKGALGTYVVDINGRRSWIRVEEYAPAPFEVTATAKKEEYIAGENLEVDIDAKYYFGVPLEGGSVEYVITSQNYYFRKYTDEYFSFGAPFYRCWYDCDYGDQFVTRGELSLSKEGMATISQKLDFENMFPKEEDRTSKIFLISVVVKNANGQSVSTQTSVIGHAGERYIGLSTASHFLGNDEEVSLKLKTVDTKGTPVPAKKIALKIEKRKWINTKRQEVDGGFYWKWEEVRELVAEKEIATNKKGDAIETFSLPDAGEYEITASLIDARGNTVRSAKEIYIYESNNSASSYSNTIVRPQNDTTLELVSEKIDLKVGYTARFLIKNPYPKAKALITIERGKIFEYRIIDVTKPLQPFEFVITENYLPNIFASVTLLAPDPALKYGQISFSVDPEEKKIDINISSDKEAYLPGEEVKLTFTATDISGNPLESELSVAVVDASVLALVGNPEKNPFVFFYNALPLTVQTSSNLKNILQERDVKKGKGGGGGSESAEGKKTRGKFEDTAFWKGRIHTNADGIATVRFSLPDNLTRWRVESLGITKDTKVGAGYSEFVTKKNIMVTPIFPRFVVPGDELSIGEKVFNRSSVAQKLTVSFRSETLLSSRGPEEIYLAPNKETTIFFSVSIPNEKQEGQHEFFLSAKNEAFEDGVLSHLKITPNETYEATATAFSTEAKKASEPIFLPEAILPEKGRLEIRSSATLAVFLSEGFNTLLRFPYGCAEQIASKLEAIALLRRGLKVNNIGDSFEVKKMEFDGKLYSLDEGLRRGLVSLLEKQNSDGGFGYYRGFSSRFYVSLRVAQTLLDLKKAGVNINASALKKVLDFLEDNVRYPKRDGSQDFSRENIILLAYIFSQSERDSAFLTLLINEKILNDEFYLREQIDALSLAYLTILVFSESDQKYWMRGETLLDYLENRLKIDARGAHIPAGKNLWWSNYESPEKNTALFLKAMVAGKRSDEQLANVVRWLLKSRDKKGAWGSTNATITVMDAMIDFMLWKQENESEFDLRISVNRVLHSDTHFGPKNILDQNVLTIAPLSKLPLGKIFPVLFEKDNTNEKPNTFYYDILLRYFLPIDKLSARDEGFFITRELYALDDKDLQHPLSSAKTGDILHGRITIIVPEERHLVAVESFIPAGTALINFNYATENKTTLLAQKKEDSIKDKIPNIVARSRTGSELKEQIFSPQFEELRDDRLFLFAEEVRPGMYVYDYYLRALVPGKFHHLPAVISEMYTPEIFGRTRGDFFTVEESFSFP